jgi:FG-GAP-like repeat
VKKSGWMRRSVVVGATLTLGVVVAAGAVVISARDAQQARAQRLQSQFEALHLAHFTLQEHAAIQSMQQQLLHPTWQELSPSERIEQIAKLALRLEAASPTAPVPSAAPFRGNTTALVFTHTGSSGFVLQRQSDCSLSLLMANYSFGASITSALSLTAATSSTAHYEQTLHAAANLTTTADSTMTCPDASSGMGAQRTVYLGKTTSGQLIGAGVGYVGLNTAGNSVFYGTVDPSGATASTFGVDTSAPGVYAFATGDLNGDGRPDLIGVDQVNAQIVVWLTQANGTLGTPVTYPVAGPASGAVVADVNGDGKADVVVATTNNGTDAVSVLTGNGDGTLNAAQSFTVPFPPQGSSYHIRSVIAADLRHKGYPDLVLSNGWVYQNNGTGVFTQVTPQAFTPMLATSAYGPDMVAADFNKDGKLDVALDIGPTIQTYLGNGDDTFALGPAYASVDNVGYIAASDLDADGNVDLWSGLASGGIFGGDQYSVNVADALMGNGDGTFQGAPSLPFVYTGTNVADINGDGVPDAIGVNPDNSMTSYIGAADGSFKTGSAIALSPATINGMQQTVGSIDGYAIGDVNGDGKADLIVSVRTANDPEVSQFLVLLGNGSGGFGAPTALTSPSFAPQGQIDTNLQFSDIRLIDVNGDGKPDLIYFYSDSYTNTYIAGIAVQLGNGDGTFKAPVSIPFYSQSTYSPITSQVIASADLNGDGKPDLILLTENSTVDQNLGSYEAQIQVALGHGDGTFASPVTVTGPSEMTGVLYGTNGYAPVVVADMNGDGKPDLVALGADSNGNTQVAVILGNGDGTFKAPMLQSYDGQYLEGVGLAVADFNSDGKPDVFISNPASVLASGIALGNGDGTLQYTGNSGETYVSEDLGLEVSGAVLSYDMNSDGVPDVLVGSVELLSQKSGSNGGSGGGGSSTPEFSLGTAPTSGTVAPGASATTTVSVTPSGGFASGVALSCSGLPSNASCVFSPTTVTPSGTAATSTLTITTTAQSASAGGPARLLFGSPGMLLAMVLLPALVRRSHRLVPRSAVAACAVVCLLLASCGGGGGNTGTGVGSGGSSSSGSGSGSAGTTPGSYTITISGVSGTMTHTTTFSLTVS